MLELPPLAHYFSPDHEQFRSALRSFVSREITPFVNEWDEAGTFPRHLYRRAAEFGATGLGYPEEYGGTPVDIFFKLVLAEEYARSGSGGVQASINSHTIALPPILKAGSEELKRRVIPPVLRGDSRIPLPRRLKPTAVLSATGGSQRSVMISLAFQKYPSSEIKPITMPPVAPSLAAPYRRPWGIDSSANAIATNAAALSGDIRP